MSTYWRRGGSAVGDYERPCCVASLDCFVLRIAHESITECIPKIPTDAHKHKHKHSYTHIPMLYTPQCVVVAFSNDVNCPEQKWKVCQAKG